MMKLDRLLDQGVQPAGTALRAAVLKKIVLQALQTKGCSLRAVH